MIQINVYNRRDRYRRNVCISSLIYFGEINNIAIIYNELNIHNSG